MSRSPSQKIYELLPVIHRLRDSGNGWPLRALFDIIQEQADGTRENISQLYDDWFVETCAEWVVPYIGDLLGVGPLAAVPDRMFSLRAFIGNTVAFRRRKGTALVLERLSQTLTRWPSVAVEYFQLLAFTQDLEHVRAGAGATADISDSEAMRREGTPFERNAHTLDVRRVSSGRGRFNIPSVGEFLWRLQSFPMEQVPATPAGNTGYHRFRFSPLGQDMALYNPRRDKSVESKNVESDLPLPLPRRPLYDQLNAQRAGANAKPTDWDVQRAIGIAWTDGGGTHQARPEDILIANLTTWGRPPSKVHPTDRCMIAVDPVLGRFSFAADVAPIGVKVSYWSGFSGATGGGCYNRVPVETMLDQTHASVESVSQGDSGLAAPLQTARLQAHGVVEISGNDVYRVVELEVAAGQILELRAQNESRPTLWGPAPTPWQIRMHRGSTLRLAGLLISAPIRVVFVNDGDSDAPPELLISHCTLVPGVSLTSDGGPAHAGTPSIEVPDTTCPLRLSLERSICGPINHPSKFGRVEVRDSAVDAMATQDALTSGVTVVERSTILGPTMAYLLELGSDSIFDGVPWVIRTQDGCVRHSYMPLGTDTDSKAPRRYRCQPVMAVSDAREAALRRGDDQAVAERQTLARLRPRFTSTRYGDPGYLQLAQGCPPEIFGGASNEAEMGVFNHLGQPQRLKNLASVLDEYLRVGLEVGVFPVT